MLVFNSRLPSLVQPTLLDNHTSPDAKDGCLCGLILLDFSFVFAAFESVSSDLALEA